MSRSAPKVWLMAVVTSRSNREVPVVLIVIVELTTPVSTIATGMLLVKVFVVVVRPGGGGGATACATGVKAKGALVAMNEEPRKLVFVARKNGRPFSGMIELEGSNVTHEPRFLSENLVISPAVGKGPKYLFIFSRPDAALVEQIVENLRERLSQIVSRAEEEQIDPAMST